MPQDVVQISCIDALALHLAFGNAHRHIPADRANLALQIAHARLARVVADDAHQGLVGEGELPGLETGLFQLALHQIALGNLALFLLGVARQMEHLHAVAQRSGDGVEHVGGGNEDHLRQVIGHGQVVVPEGIVLLRVEHLQHGRRWVTVHAGAKLVNFIEHHDAATGAGLFERLDDVAGQGADVGAPVAPDLGLVVHPAQRDPGKFATQRACDGLAQRSLANPRRPHQAQDRAVAARFEFAHRQKFKDALFDLFQAEVVVIEHLARLRHVDGIGLRCFPGDFQQPVQIGAHHRIFGRAVRHTLQPLEFFFGLFGHLLGHAGLVDQFVQFSQFGRVVAAVFTEFFLDFLELRAQQELTLALADAGLGALVDVARQVQHLDAVHQHVNDAVQPLAQVDLFEQFLFFGRLDVHVSGHQIGQHAGAVNVLHRLQHLLGYLGQQLQYVQRTLLELHVAGFYFPVALGRGLNDALDTRHHEIKAVQVSEHPKTLLPLANDVVRTIRRGDIAQDGGHGPHGRQVIGRRVVGLRVALHQDADRPLGLDGVLGRIDRALTANADGQDHAWKQHHVAHRHDDHGIVRQQGFDLVHDIRSRVSRRQPFCSTMSATR